MKKALFSLVLMALALSSTSFAQGAYNAITNDDNPNGNTATVFELSGSPASLTVSQTLHTGGYGTGYGYFADNRVVLENNGTCLFVADSGSNDIASFQATSKNPLTFNPTPSVIPTHGTGFEYGIGMATTPNGKLLFATLDESQEVAIFTVAPDCNLTAAGTIAERDYISAMAVTNDGKVLIVPEPNNSTVDAFAISTTSPYLTPLGPSIYFFNVPSCSAGCNPSGVDISDVVNGGANVVLANSTTSPSYITLRLDEQHGLSQGSAALHTVTGTAVTNIQSVWYSSAAVMGNGFIYLGASGYGPGGDPAGISVNKVINGVINPAAVGSYVIDGGYYASNAQGTSNADIQGNEYVWQSGANSKMLNTMYVYKVSHTGAVTLYTSLGNPNAQNNADVFSLTAFPKR